MNDIQKQMFAKAVNLFCENITRELKQLIHYAESIKLDKAGIGQPSIPQHQIEAVDAIKRNINEQFGKLGSAQAENVGNNDSQAAGVCPEANQRRIDRLNGLVAQEPAGYHLNEIAKQLNDSTLNHISQVATGIRDLKEGYEKQIAALKAQLTGSEAATKRVCQDRDLAIEDVKRLHSLCNTLNEDKANLRIELADTKALLEQSRKSLEAHQNEKVEYRDRCRVLGNRIVQIQSILNGPNA